MSRSHNSQSLSLHDLLDTLLSDHMAKEESHRQEERRRFEPYEKYLERRVQTLAKKRSQLKREVVNKQGKKELREPSDSDLRQIAYSDGDKWAKKKYGDEGLEPAWEQTLWEYAVDVLVSDHAFKGTNHKIEVDVPFGRLRWFLRLRRLVQQGEPEPQERESLADLADLAVEMDRLNTPKVVRELLLKLWTKSTKDCEAVGLPKPAPDALQGGPGTKPKGSTGPGKAEVKMIAALTKHHQYAESGCLNLEPIGVRELKKKAMVGQGSSSRFFKKMFGGHEKYRHICCDAAKLGIYITQIRGEYSPDMLFGRQPPAEGRRDEDD